MAATGLVDDVSALIDRVEAALGDPSQLRALGEFMCRSLGSASIAPFRTGLTDDVVTSGAAQHQRAVAACLDTVVSGAQRVGVLLDQTAGEVTAAHDALDRLRGELHAARLVAATEGYGLPSSPDLGTVKAVVNEARQVHDDHVRRVELLTQGIATVLGTVGQALHRHTAASYSFYNIIGVSVAPGGKPVFFVGTRTALDQGSVIHRGLSSSTGLPESLQEISAGPVAATDRAGFTEAVRTYTLGEPADAVPGLLERPYTVEGTFFSDRHGDQEFTGLAAVVEFPTDGDEPGGRFGQLLPDAAVVVETMDHGFPDLVRTTVVVEDASGDAGPGYDGLSTQTLTQEIDRDDSEVPLILRRRMREWERLLVQHPELLPAVVDQMGQYLRDAPAEELAALRGLVRDPREDWSPEVRIEVGDLLELLRLVPARAVEHLFQMH